MAATNKALKAEIQILRKKMNIYQPRSSNLRSLLSMAQLISTLLFVLLATCSAASRIYSTSHASASTADSVGLVQFLAPHNAVRSSLRLPQLAWDPRLAGYALSYAMRRREDCALIHSGGPYGENIFWGSGGGWSPAQAVAAWAGERQWYTLGSNSCAPGRMCGHYTQIVWRATRRVGCASVKCSGGRGQFMVCEYYPPGNYIGERPY